MAHAGKLYPVLFRRDWNLNVFDNDDGFANRYIVTLKGQGTGLGTILFGSTWDCGPATNRFVTEMHWETDFKKFGLFFFALSLRADIPAALNGYTIRVHIIESHAGEIATIQLGVDGQKQGGFVQGPGDSTVFWNPAWFDHYPFLELSTYRKKRWIDGPPH